MLKSYSNTNRYFLSFMIVFILPVAVIVFFPFHHDF